MTERKPKPESQAAKPSFPMDDGDLLHVLFETLSDALYFKDVSGKYVRINRVLASWYGLKSPAKAVGRTDADFFPKELARATQETEEEILKTGVPRLDMEEKLVWPDGRASWVHTSKIPLKDKSGKTVGLFGQSRDISAHKQAEDEIRRSEALYRSLVDNLPQNYFRKDREGRVVFANRQYCMTAGKPLKEILGKTDFDFYPPELARKYREDDTRVMQTGKVFEAVEAHQPPGKPTIYVRVVKSPIEDAERRIIGVQGIFWEVPPEK